MNVTVLTGGATHQCASTLLANAFSEGAREAGHDVYLFDTAKRRVEVCLGCGRCGRGKSICVRKESDAMLDLAPKLTESERVAFVVPIGGSGVPEMLERTIERIYTNHFQWKGGDRKAYLILVPGDASDSAASDFIEHYRWFVNYLDWSDGGVLSASGGGAAAEMESTDFPEQARRLGASLS